MREVYSDELNPKYIFNTIRAELLSSLLKKKIDVNLIIRKELANRGLDLNGEWVGFPKAEKILKKYEKTHRKKSKTEREFDKIKDRYVIAYEKSNGEKLKGKVYYSNGFIYVPASFGEPHKRRLNEFRDMLKNLESRVKKANA